MQALEPQLRGEKQQEKAESLQSKGGEKGERLESSEAEEMEVSQREETDLTGKNPETGAKERQEEQQKVRNPRKKPLQGEGWLQTLGQLQDPPYEEKKPLIRL